MSESDGEEEDVGDADSDAFDGADDVGGECNPHRFTTFFPTTYHGWSSHYRPEDELDIDMDEVRIRSDPYAGVFFSKDRVETIIETVDPIRRVNVVAPEGSEAKARGEGKVEVQLLGSGAWMSGCPEGGELQ